MPATSDADPSAGPPTSVPVVRVALLNDFDIVVAGLTAMLADHRDRVQVVSLDGEPVDVVLVDAFAHTEPLTEVVRSSPAPVVVYTWTHDGASVARALDAGAAGVLTKSLEVDDLLSAVSRVAGGEVVVELGEAPADEPAELDEPDEPGDSDLPRAPGAWPGKEHGLSPRESEVIALLSRGLSNDDIGRALFLGINTVKTYIRSAYRKMGVTTRTRAVLWALGHGFGDDHGYPASPGTH